MVKHELNNPFFVVPLVNIQPVAHWLTSNLGSMEPLIQPAAESNGEFFFSSYIAYCHVSIYREGRDKTKALFSLGGEVFHFSFRGFQCLRHDVYIAFSLEYFGIILGT